MDVRIGFACKERWEDMVGDERVRDCRRCDRPVFNLSAMTRAEAEAVLATRGVTPCVRFYRRPDGTVMTRDCPIGAPPARRRLTVLASTVAAGATLAVTPAAIAEPLPPVPPPVESSTREEATPAEPSTVQIRLEHDYLQGLPVQRSLSYEAEMGGVMSYESYEPRPEIEWSVWGRVGVGGGSQQPGEVARSVSPPMDAGASASTELAAGADLTVGVARHDDLRFGAWAELRTSSDPVAGGELVLEGLPPHPYDSRIGGTGSIVVRAGANTRIVTGAVGVGYVGSFPRHDPLVPWARHVVGARVVLSVNRSLDARRDWSATVGLELDPIAAARAFVDLVTRR